MSASESAEAAALRVAEIIGCEQAIEYAAAMPDNDHPGITWSIFGLPASGEIAVLVRAGTLVLGMVAPSTLLVPTMSERIFGIDISDERLAERLSDELWAEHSARLISAALQHRGH